MTPAQFSSLVAVTTLKAIVAAVAIAGLMGLLVWLMAALVAYRQAHERPHHRDDQ